MHVYNRTVGSTGEFPFGPTEKEEFVVRLKRLCQLYVIEPIAVQVMGNHFHAILFIPGQVPSNEVAADRHKQYYGLKRRILTNSPRCAELAKKLRDVSEFMRELQQPYTRWFNRTRSRRRRGHLWAGRFKNTILESGLAVWDCWLYVEMNPVRARMISDPADYRFCSYGEWAARGRNPFESGIQQHVLPWLGDLLQVDDIDGVRQRMRVEFARVKAVEDRQRPDEVETAIAVAAEKERFVTRLDRRVRYWVDGLVIGSDRFVLGTVGRYRPRIDLAKRRLVRAISPTSPTTTSLYSFKQLRVLLE